MALRFTCERFHFTTIHGSALGDTKKFSVIASARSVTSELIVAGNEPGMTDSGERQHLFWGLIQLFGTLWRVLILYWLPVKMTSVEFGAHNVMQIVRGTLERLLKRRRHVHRYVNGPPARRGPQPANGQPRRLISRGPAPSSLAPGRLI